MFSDPAHLMNRFQYRRSVYEERLLRATFPEYEEFGRTTPRLIPFVW
jgi:protein-S-isoprenylcysteine O-methyltransferase Ste14